VLNVATALDHRMSNQDSEDTIPDPTLLLPIAVELDKKLHRSLLLQFFSPITFSLLKLQVALHRTALHGLTSYFKLELALLESTVINV
jgi:hypothetical protein